LNPQPNLIDIPPLSNYHAFLISPVIAHDPGEGDLIDLELPNGDFFRAQAGVAVLRLGEQISGPWRATLHVETNHHARILEPIHVPRLARLTPDRESFSPTWSAAGRVVHLDRDEGLATIRVFPKTGLVQPFLITAITSLEHLTSVEHAPSLRLKGTLHDRHLIAIEVQALDLDIPGHWRSWQPPVSSHELEVLGQNRKPDRYAGFQSESIGKPKGVKPR
jgi:hypothetical protein